MAKKWYPVVDILSCVECGTCVNFCPHGVYNKQKAPSPIVVNPDACIDHCHGCGNKCPEGAITYVGDDTGWMPPALQGKADTVPECGCGCSAEKKNTHGKELRIEYLYLDLNTCDRCIGTDAVLEEVIEVLRPALTLAGYTVDYQKHEITSAQLAEKYHFLSSPTILVNGQDIFGTVQESNCDCCGEIAGVDVDCRVFEHNGETYEVPTSEMLADAILKSVYVPSGCSCGEYEIPENLKRFFEGKSAKCSCNCGNLDFN